ncbi:MAG TPA: substrate-binding domain-containing protein [Chloroflexia bacterium]|nr:substrate-binding domain-containing protein [Chloroflexia bacterium]
MYLKRSYFVVVALLLAALVLSACGDSTSTPAPVATSTTATSTTSSATTVAGASSGKKLMVLWATKQEAVWGFQEEAIKKAAAADGVQITFKNADNNVANQAADVDDAISQKPDAVIFVAVDTSTAASLVRKLKDAKIPVVADDRLPDASNVDIYVTADSHKVGMEQAKYLAQKSADKGNILLLEGETGNSVAAAITQGNKDELKSHPGIKVLLDQAHDKWSREAAQATTTGALNKNGKDQIQGILANNSGMAMGAVTAAKKAGVDLSKTCIIGSDADKDAVESIIAGELCADVDKRPLDLGAGSYAAARALMRGQTPDKDTVIKNGTFDIPVKYTPIQLINKSNVGDMKYRYPEIKFPS